MRENQSPAPFYKENPFWGAIGGFLTFLFGGLGFEVSGYPFLGELLFWIALPWAFMAVWLSINGLTENKKYRRVAKVLSVLILGLIMVLIRYLAQVTLPPENVPLSELL